MIVHWNGTIIPWSNWWKLGSVINSGWLQPDNLVGLCEDQEHPLNSLFHVQQPAASASPAPQASLDPTYASTELVWTCWSVSYPRISNFLKVSYSSKISFCSDLYTFSFHSHCEKEGPFYYTLWIFHAHRSKCCFSFQKLNWFTS